MNSQEWAPGDNSAGVANPRRDFSGVGYVQEYPCTCRGEGAHICWIVRHPSLAVPVSYRTREKAEAELKELEEKK